MRFVETHRAPADQIVSVMTATFAYRRYYARPWPSAYTPDQLTAIRAEGAPVWAVYTLPRYIETLDPALMAQLRRDCRDARVFRGTLAGGDVRVCRLDPVR